MPGNIDKYYNLVLKLVNEGGKLIKQRVWKPKTIKTKLSVIDLVTETDLEIEKLLISGIGKEFPEHKFIGEETTASGVKPELTVAPTWIIDPVDGTMNFVHGYPCVCISIALLINKISEIGIIYNPVVETLFTARRGKGAFLNGNKIKTSSNTDLEKSLIIIEAGSSKNKDRETVIDENVKLLRPKVHAIRTSGSAAWNMAIVGLGGADAYLEYGLHIWDMAAGDLIIREAGGTVVDPTGKALDLMSCRMLCAGTDQLAKELSGVIKQYYPPRDA